ncbi:MAG: hypothetical protein MJ002_07935 [Paludibacteraceae bacterium]|nr:hypothetical protein [Paludibacteraceae bacterium]
MKRITIINIVFVVLFLVVANCATGQNIANSPFSRYGYGQLEDGCFSRGQSLGGLSYGLYSPVHINPANPATFTSTDSITFLFEVGISGLWSNFKSNGASENSFSGKLDYIALQFPVTKWLGMSAGLLPFSYVGYNYGVDDSIPLAGETSMQKYHQTFQGSGGINEVYLGLTFNILDYVTIGANGYYMFGNLKHYRTMMYTVSDALTYAAIVKEQEHINNFNVRFGVQYHQPIGRDHKLTLGAIYEFRSRLHGDYTMSKLSVDTLEVSNDNGSLFELPQVWGVGFSYCYQDRLTIGADFTMQEFGNAKFAGKRDSLENRMRVAAGIEYIHNPQGRRYIDRMWWRLGANYRNSYTRVQGETTKDFSVTFGVGFPLRTAKTVIHFNMEYGNIGANKFEALKEQYIKFGLSFSLNETWFVKNKIR